MKNIELLQKVADLVGFKFSSVSHSFAEVELDGGVIITNSTEGEFVLGDTISVKNEDGTYTQVGSGTHRLADGMKIFITDEEGKLVEIKDAMEEETEDEAMNDDELMEDVSKRSPTSPEILMNNLRGDVRSVDARYQELADMLGDQVASETPPEVLAMLQSKFAAEQAPAGIGALPPGQGMAPPPSMPPSAGAPMPTTPQAPAMPPMPGPAAQGPGAAPAPQGFAYGGMVSQAPGYGPGLDQMPGMYQAPLSQNPQGFAQGGIASLPQSGANYHKGVSYNGPEMETSAIAQQGRGGDTMLAHLTPEQHAMLTSMGGGSTTNPKTGLPEHWLAAMAPMANNVIQRATPYAQAANQYAGNLLNPILTKPTFEQSRSTLGTFLPKAAEGLELSYPTLTQRVGMATEPVRQAIANSPTAAKVGAAFTAIPGAGAVANAFGGGQESPTMPTSNAGNDVPLVITRDAQGNPVFNQPPPLPGKGPLGLTAGEQVVAEPSVVDKAMNPPTEPKSVEELVDQQTKAPAEKKGLENRLDAYMKENLPVFEKYMGGNKEDTQIQALLLLADAGLEYATTGARTPMMALANAAKRLPGGLGQLAAQESARKSQISGAALTSGLQTIAAEDKATAALQKEVIRQAITKGELVPTDLGAGLTNYRGKQGEDRGMKVDPTVTTSFLQSTFTPQVVKDDKGEVVGMDTPYAKVSGTTSQTINTDKGTRERLAAEISRQEAALRSIDSALNDYTTAFGPKAFVTNFKNNTVVPVSPLDPNVVAEKKRTQILTAFNTAGKAIARTGDTGNIAVAEQKGADYILGDKPGTFFSDPETALARIMAVRTDIANQRLATAQQLGWINQDIQLEVPNLGTKNDPIPQDKLTYVTKLAKANPSGQVYIMTPKGTQQVLLSTLQQ